MTTSGEPRELNRAGMPVQNANYWRRQHLKLEAKIKEHKVLVAEIENLLTNVETLLSKLKEELKNANLSEDSN